jgi:hypothetical protein
VRQLNEKVDRLTEAISRENIAEPHVQPQKGWQQANPRQGMHKDAYSEFLDGLLKSGPVERRSDLQVAKEPVMDLRATKENCEIPQFNEKHNVLPRQESFSHRKHQGNELHAQLQLIDRKISIVAETVGINNIEGSSSIDDDRRRLKERLRSALNNEQIRNRYSMAAAPRVWLEYVFGIARPDRKRGIHGSRSLSLYSISCLAAALMSIFQAYSSEF